MANNELDPELPKTRDPAELAIWQSYFGICELKSDALGDLAKKAETRVPAGETKEKA